MAGQYSRSSVITRPLYFKAMAKTKDWNFVVRLWVDCVTAHGGSIVSVALQWTTQLTLPHWDSVVSDVLSPSATQYATGSFLFSTRNSKPRRSMHWRSHGRNVAGFPTLHSSPWPLVGVVKCGIPCWRNKSATHDNVGQTLSVDKMTHQNDDPTLSATMSGRVARNLIHFYSSFSSTLHSFLRTGIVSLTFVLLMFYI